MCIILTCEPYVRPDHDLIETCFNNNPDGAGIMWCEDGVVRTEKGFSTVRSLEESISYVPKSSRLVIHMRIATSGGIDVGTCHPFPISDDLDTLHAPYMECDAALVHNGIISGVPTDAKLGISDTVYFVQHYVNTLYHEEGLTKGALRRIKSAAPGNRFAIMTKDGTVHRIGIGWETVTKGIQASNSSWRYDKYSYLLSNYAWDDDDWDDWGYSYGSYRRSTSSEWADDWDYNYNGGWREGTQDGYYEHLNNDDEFDELIYDPNYVKIFEPCAGCKEYASCMSFGPICDSVAEEVDDYLYMKQSA